jgi:hypothetical protein
MELVSSIIIWHILACEQYHTSTHKLLHKVLNVNAAATTNECRKFVL